MTMLQGFEGRMNETIKEFYFHADPSDYLEVLNSMSAAYLASFKDSDPDVEVISDDFFTLGILTTFIAKLKEDFNRIEKEKLKTA